MDRDDIIKKFAREHKISAERVPYEMQKLIDDAFSDPSPEVRLFWEKIPKIGEKPTPDELIDFILHEADKEHEK